MAKLNKILLIDDEEASNFLNQIVIRQSNLAKEIVTFERAAAALEYLLANIAEGNKPDLVLLDINMPLMDGWEFVHELSEKVVTDPGIVIIMLTSSINPSDEKRANETKYIAGFKSKPLSTEMLNEIVNEYF